MDRRSLLLPLVVLAAMLLALYTRQPPGTAASTGFSTENAQAIVADVARAPHPVGTIEHLRVRDMLKARFSALGLAVETQADFGVRQSTKKGMPISVSPFENIIVTLPGRDRTKPAIALMAHYDSAPWSHGAADDGAGIAAALETARVLAAGPKPARDVVFLLTDAEEAGLIGAEGFFKDQARADRIGAVVNLEARGSSGRAFMFQTSKGNQELVALWAKHAVSPSGNSMADAVYKLLPNDTDLSVPLGDGIDKIGINAAFVDGLQDYHMPTDTAANLDSRSLTHLGNFALTTTRALAMAERLPARTGDSAFFDFFGLGVVQYPISWGWALVVLAVLLLVTAPVRNVGTSWPRIAWATLGAGWLFVGAALLCHLIAIPLYDYGAIGMRERVNEMAPFMWVCIAVCSGLTLILRPKVTSWIGSVVLLTIIALVAQQWLPGASWLFGWAAAVGAGMVALAARTRIDTPVLLVVCVVLGGIWGALLLQGVITTYVSTAPITPAPIALIVPFALALIGPLIILFGKSNWTRLVPAGLLGMAAAGVLLLALTSSFSPRKPKPGDLFHLTDTNISKAFLATTSGPRQLPPGLARRFMPTGFSYFAFWRVPWSDTLVIPPSLTIVQSNGRATLRMAGNGEPHRAMMFLIKPSSDLQNASLNGKPVVLTGGVPTRISYRPQTNGDMALTFDSASGGNLEIDYLYATPGMPAGTPAPDGPTTDWTWFSGTRMVIGSTTLVW